MRENFREKIKQIPKFQYGANISSKKIKTGRKELLKHTYLYVCGIYLYITLLLLNFFS